MDFMPLRLNSSTLTCSICALAAIILQLVAMECQTLHIVYSLIVVKYCCKHVSNSDPSSFDTCKHFDYNITSLTSIVINCSVSSGRNNH